MVLEIQKLKQELEIQKKLYQEEVNHFNIYKQIHSIPNYQYHSLKFNFEKLELQQKFNEFEKEIIKKKLEKEKNIKMPSPIKRVYEPEFEDSPLKRIKVLEDIEDNIPKQESPKQETKQTLLKAKKANTSKSSKDVKENHQKRNSKEEPKEESPKTIKQKLMSPKKIPDYETKKTKKSIFSFQKLINFNSSRPTLKKKL